MARKTYTKKTPTQPELETIKVVSEDVLEKKKRGIKKDVLKGPEIEPILVNVAEEDPRILELESKVMFYKSNSERIYTDYSVLAKRLDELTLRHNALASDLSHADGMYNKATILNGVLFLYSACVTAFAIHTYFL